MNRRRQLINELQKILVPSKDEYFVKYAGKYYKFEDCGYGFIPKPGAVGIEHKARRMDEYIQLKDVRIYF